MKIAGSILVILGFVTFFLAIVALYAYFLTIVWPVVVPMILPGLVKSGSVAGTVSFNTAFIIAIVTLPAKMIKSKNSKKE